MRPRPAGADNFLKWRRSIDEHLELRRITWDEYAMFNWLCTKASPRTGALRTSWPTLAEQTGLTPNHVEKLCRALKRKRYVWYPAHRGARGRLVDVAIHKYPLVQGTYTDLSARFAAEPPAEVPADVPADRARFARSARARPFRADVLAEVPAEPRRVKPLRRRAVRPPEDRDRDENKKQTETETPVPCGRASGSARPQGSLPRAAARSPRPWPSETSSPRSPGGDRLRMAVRVRPRMRGQPAPRGMRRDEGDADEPNEPAPVA